MGRPRCCHLEPNQWPRGLDTSVQRSQRPRLEGLFTSHACHPGGVQGAEAGGHLRTAGPPRCPAPCGRGPREGREGRSGLWRPRPGWQRPTLKPSHNKGISGLPRAGQGCWQVGDRSRGQGRAWGTTERAGGDGRVGASLAHSTHTYIYTHHMHSTHSPHSHRYRHTAHTHTRDTPYTQHTLTHAIHHGHSTHTHSHTLTHTHSHVHTDRKSTRLNSSH